MKRMWLHRICAHPTAISWLLGAFILNAFVLMGLVVKWGDFATLLEPSILLWSLGLLIPTSLLGFFVGVPFSLTIGRFCDHMNGAPFAIGERVVILRGAHMGMETQVRGFTEGQGGAKLLVLDLGEDANKRFEDLFGECHVTRVRRLTTCSPGSHPSRP